MMATDLSLRGAATRFARSAQAFARLSGQTDAELPAELTELLALFAEQPEWRVFVDGTRNLGHQASTVMLLRRMIELSCYAGRVVLVYADADDAAFGGTPAKLAMMFAGVDPARLDCAVAAYGSCRDIRFLPFEHRTRLGDAIAFGFTGGADDMAINLALELRVRYFARLQPYLWDDPIAAFGDAYFESSRIEQPSGEHLYPVEAYPPFHGLALKPAQQPGPGMDDTSWQWFARNDNVGARLASRTRTARALLAARNDEHHTDAPWLWPVYGIQHFKARAAELFLACALLAFSCLDKAPGAIVVCSFSPHDALTADWASLIEALSRDLAQHRAGLPGLGRALRRRYRAQAGATKRGSGCLDAWVSMLDVWLRSRPTVARLYFHRDATTAAHACVPHFWPGSGRPDGGPDRAVHIVALGPVPMDVFHHCLANADLPACVEGQAAANLMRSRGLPFLQILRKEHVNTHGVAPCLGLEGVPDMAGKAAAASAMLCHFLDSSTFDTASTSAALLRQIDAVGTFMRAASDPASDVAVYFRQLGRYVIDNGRDKLLVMLLAMREVILSADANENAP